MKNKIIIISITVLCLVISLIVLLLSNNNKKKDKTNIDKIDKTSSVEEKVEVVEEEPIIELEQEIIESVQETPVQEEPKQENKQTANKETTVKKKETTQTPKQETKSVEQQPVSEKKEESGVVDSSGNAVKEEQVKTVVKQPWEQIGISEYDWYHKPVYNWMRIDYDVSSCGSKANCEALCMSDAEELAFTENVSCIQVYSHSGAYLGEMLKKE